uniref:Uncharacterized protein n=1 Tax=Arundo donax TaxID=35708 RepID=A0A0A9HC62_ARUDO
MEELRQGADRYFKDVIWNIFDEVREMTKEHAADLMAPLEGCYRHNCRPKQPLNSRTVQLYDRPLKTRKML